MKKGYVVAVAIGVIAAVGVVGFMMTHPSGSQQGDTKEAPPPCMPYRCGQWCKSLASIPVDHMDKLFTVGADKAPFMRTVRYSKKNSWAQKKAPGLYDYANRYQTSAELIARSLDNGQEENAFEKIAQGARFNVISENIQFHIVVDLAHCQMYLYAVDQSADHHYLVKNYQVAVGKFNPYVASRSETPHGKFSLLRCSSLGTVNMDSQVQEIVQMYGTRYLQFGDDEQVYAILGNRWMEKGGQYIEESSTLGTYSTEGEVRMSKEDLEQIYAVVSSRPTVVEIVSDVRVANVPGTLVEF